MAGIVQRTTGLLGRGVFPIFTKRLTPKYIPASFGTGKRNVAAVVEQTRNIFGSGMQFQNAEEEMVGHYPGHGRLEFTSQMDVIDPTLFKQIPVYQVLNTKGELLCPVDEVQLGDETLLKIYNQMITLNTMDKILYESQRQGRISFYMTCYGEEATHFGSATALDFNDLVFAQYREAGVLMWRGFSLDDFMNQCYGNEHDEGKGRQMPVHYGSSRLNFVTISSPLGTQMPQASGAAYALKMKGSNNCAICYFGEGAASEGDAHAAFNFAATLSCPVIFFCRNNGYAISTPANEQYRGDGLVSRAPSYGMAAIRVDGNDILAVYNAVKKAREICMTENRPVIVEAMTYRVGHHSTSDDSSAYRSAHELKYWKEVDSPINRLRSYLENKGLWDDEKDAGLKKKAMKEIMAAFGRAEKAKKPPVADLFNDVYDVYPKRLERQYEDLLDHLKKYPNEYPVQNFKS